MARGHSGKVLLGRRVIIPGLNPTNALAPATGFVSTARDLALFFGQLAPGAKRSILSLASRREMVRRQWREPNVSVERHYGQGIVSGTLNGWDWFGHSGGFQGFITRTSVLPDHDLTVSVLTNSSDGLAHFWLDGTVQILRAFRDNGAPSRRVRDWHGRWWTSWGALDLVPMGNKVVMAGPAFFNPFLDASEIAVTSRNAGRIALAAGLASHGEPVALKRNQRGRITEVVAAGTRFSPEARIVREVEERYAAPKKKKRRKNGRR
jgi:CubicO group peptidase (beta-lactamase class C family)